MCGRYALTRPPEALRAFFGYPERPDFPPREAVAPTEPIAIVGRDPLRPRDPTPHFRLVRWGFVPGFVRDFAGFPLIVNAWAEEMEEKPSFRAAALRRRCLVMADATFATQRPAGGGRGRRFRLQRRDGAPLALTGLWEGWMGADGSEIDTACIVTVPATGLPAAVHPRMPGILEPADWDLWLSDDPAARTPAIALLRPPPDDTLTVEPAA